MLRARRRQRRRAATSRDVADAMRAEEGRLLVERTADAPTRRNNWPAVGHRGSVPDWSFCWPRISIFLVQRIAQRARRGRGQNLRDNNVNLEADRRIAHRRPERGQRRNPALRLYRQPRPALAAGQHHGLHQRAGGAARRHLRAHRNAAAEPECADVHGESPEPDAAEQDEQLCARISTKRSASSRSSIGKMDRLINAILKLSREGRREFKPEQIDMPRTDRRPSPRPWRIRRRGRETKIRIGAAADGRQRPPGDGADLLQSDRQCAEISAARRPGRHRGHGPHKDSRYAIVSRSTDNGRGIDPGRSSADLRSVPPGRVHRTPGRRHRPGPCARAGAAAWAAHVGVIGARQRQHLHGHAAARWTVQNAGMRQT